MKTTYHSHLRGTNGCLGFYYGLNALLSDFPEGGLPGEFFINGETQSIWMWDVATSTWINTNHVSPAPFMGLVEDPETFSPSLSADEKGCFIYVVGQKGTYKFPLLRGSDTVSVMTGSAGIITLIWDGTFWHTEFTPLSFDNTGSPIGLFRGEWVDSQTYRCANGFSDIVSYCGDYYRLKSLVEEADNNLCPDESDEWEYLSNYSAIADKLQLAPDEVVAIKENQEIQIFDESGISWTLGNGEIKHTSTGCSLNGDGKIHFPIDGDTMISISKQDKGLVIIGQGENGDEICCCSVVIDEEGNGMVEVCHVDDESTHYRVTLKPNNLEVNELGVDDCFENRVYITPQGIEINKVLGIYSRLVSITPDEIKASYYDKNKYVPFAHFTRERANMRLKYIDDDLELGDLYYDDDGMVHYCYD